MEKTQKYKMTDKTKLRKHFAKIRKNIPQDDIKRFSRQACDLFLQKITSEKNDIIALYHPINNEINPLALSQGATSTCLPIIVKPNSPLAFRAWKDGDKLTHNDIFKTNEPCLNTCEALPTIMIVPTLAFDRRGHRLGYGGGFYDRTIHAFKDNGHKLTTVGLAYSCQQTDDDLPDGEFDHLLDYIITEKEVIKF